jgi:ABC-type branched-subunit amino acid transport system ATPase component
MVDIAQNERILDVRSLVSGYRSQPVLHEVSLRVSGDEHVALIGANGCGKSTLLRTIMNLVKADSGEVVYLDSEITRLKPEAIACNGIGYLKQTENVFSQLTVRDNLLLAANWSVSDSKRRDTVLDQFSTIRDQIETRAGLLSGGQRQALALAMILARPVKLLLLDEPISGLSPKASVELLASLERLREQFPFSSIVVEHQLKRIQPFVNRVVVMREGRIIDDTTDTTRMLDAGWLDRRYRNEQSRPGNDHSV